MLDPWIIEEILKREKERRDGERPRADLPLEGPPRYKDSGEYPVPSPSPPPSEEGERGVIIMEI
ncbi:MAG: hypothetical protein KA297_01275 [Kofleriaceae bacterium]|nr:hypothetical protein [Kofleriaceae bacterium]MBP6839262.1 hypothetical protein [Kofleriaceae bacterium]